MLDKIIKHIKFHPESDIEMTKRLYQDLPDDLKGFVVVSPDIVLKPDCTGRLAMLKELWQIYPAISRPRLIINAFFHPDILASKYNDEIYSQEIRRIWYKS